MDIYIDNILVKTWYANYLEKNGLYNFGAYLSINDMCIIKIIVNDIFLKLFNKKLHY